MAQSLALLPEGTRSEASLRNANMTPTWAYAVALSEPTGIQADALFSNDGIVTWAAKDSAKPGRPSDYETWVIHFSANWTANHLDASEQLLEQQSRHLLERLSGKALNIHESFQHRWLYARSTSQETPVIQWDVDKRIGLAGDWTIGSRLEDAWQSAQTLADQVLAEF
jgi:predicted NAD/FAD-dependent oxidoreductase